MIRRLSSFKMNAIWIYLIITAFGTNKCLGERANPLKNPHICGRPHCETENAKFNYAANIRYYYDYSSHIRTEFSGSGQNTSDIYVSGTVSVTFPKKCEGILTVTNIELRGTLDSDESLHAKSTEFAADVQRNDLRFSFHDGLIDELCPDIDEPNWVMNFKRGILSSFQNTMKRFDIDYKTSETDVSGTCDVSYVVNGAQKTELHITKRKDIASCENRYKTNSIIQTTPYDFRKQYSALPILQSISYCNTTIDHHVYQEVNCSERHQFVPFSNNETGAVTTSLITLKLTDEPTYMVVEPSSTTYDDENVIKKREKLLFNHYPTPKRTTGEIRAIRLLLQKMCKFGFPDIKRPFIDAFSKFLQMARLLSSSALHQLFARASGICESDNGKNHIFESLPFIGSTASVEMMTNEIIKTSVNNDIAQKWLTSMSFLPRPDNQMLASLYKMFEHKHTDSDPIFIFSPTAVVHTYCRNHPDCIENEQVQKFVKLLETDANEYLKKDLSIRTNREKVIVLLRGLGNIGIMTKQFRYHLRQVIHDESIPVEIRVNIIASHRRTDCEHNRDFFLDTYRNMTMNSEIRIAAYLETIRCSDYLTVKHIKYVLQTEEVNQVGSFVWSHLKNLAESASPIRVAAQSLLVDDDLRNKYRLDFRKFSHNFEHSLFFDEYNVGVNSEANLIFGTDSYMPRSASYNFTVDLFGESVNVFEISAYMQGFEHMVEGIFGPRGPLSTEGFSNKVDAVKQYFRGKVNPYKAELERINMRLRRDSKKGQEDTVDNILNEDEDEYELENENSDKPKVERNTNTNHVQELQNDVKALNFDFKYNMNNPRAAFGLKIFGNDVKYKTFEDMREIYSLLYQMNPTNQLKQLLSGKEIIYTKSGVFLEVSYEVPLSSGFPLALQAYGASSIDLRASGSLQVDSFWNNPKFAIKGKLKPSISLDIIATMQSDYYYGSSGIRVKSNLYSSSSVEANLTLNGKNHVSLQFGLPQDRNDIISARSELVVLQYDEDIRQPGIQKRYTNSTCMWSGFERALGLKVCSDYSLPDVSKSERPLPSLLLCGPIDIEVHIDKADLSAKAFSFEYNWIESADKSSGSFVFQTPNTNISRIFSANLTKEPDIYALEMRFENGRTMHSATATYKNTNDEKLVEAHLRIDGQKSFALEMGIDKSPIQNGWNLHPKFSLTVNNEQVARISGTVKKIGKNKITQYDSDLEFVTKRFNGRLLGYVTTTDTKYSIRLIANYKFVDRKEELIDFECELEGTQDGYRTNQVGMVKWNSTAYRKYNFKANVTYKRVLGHIDLGINVNNAIDFIDPKYNLGIRIAFIKTEPDDKEFNSRTNLSIEVIRPISKINYKFMIKYNSKLKRGPMHNIMLLFRYAEGKEATAVISAMLPSVYTRNIDFYLNVAIPDYSSCIARFRAIERTRRQQYEINVEGQWFTGHSIKVYGTYDDKSSTQESRHQLKLMAESPHFSQTSILAKYFLNDTMMTIQGDFEYGQNPYGLMIRHNHVSMYEQSVYAELKVLEKHYWISARLSDEQFRKLAIDLHIDRIREIRFIIGGQSTSHKKEIEVKVSWDSNRDPTQELFLNLEFNTPKAKIYDGGFTISYPQRAFSGSFDLAVPGPTYRGTASIGWRANETLHVSFDSGAIYEPEKHFWVDVKLNTPFNGWQNNMVQGHVFQAKNLLSSNATILWAETQQLIFGLLTDHEFTNESIKCEAHFLVNSTVKEIPTIDALFKHNQNAQHYISDIAIRHVAYKRKPNLFGINSNWHLNFNEFYSNITGSIMLQTPLKGYTKGALATKFSLSSSKTLKGAADFELEQKKFTLAVDGVVKRITDCMLVVNITTPIDKYRTIVSRFGLINRNRHFVAEVRAPNGALGIEVKFTINSINDFDIMLNLETPIEEFKKIMLIGKLTSDTVDFRGGLNRFVLGYVGVSRLATIQDFEYSWKVYTPLDGFEESSLVVKYIRKKVFDMEVMLKFAQKKLGVVVNGKWKQKLITLPKVEHYLPFNSRLSDDFDRFDKYFEPEPNSDEDDESEEDESESEAEIEDSWSLSGQMELNTIIWPEIVGFLDVDDFDEEYYLVRGNLNLPIGNIEVDNNLYFPHIMSVRNSLKVNTPFASAKQIELLYFHAANLGHYYVSAFEIFYKNGSDWIELGFNSNYTKVRDVDLKTHEVEVNLLLPFESLRRVVLGGNVEIADTIYRANISGRTLNTFISTAASLEQETNFIDVTAGVVLTSLALPYYALNVFFKQDFSGRDNSLAFGFKENYNAVNEFRAEATWQSEASQFYKYHSKVNTNLFPIYFAESSLMLNRTSNFILLFDLNVNSIVKKGIAFHIGAKKRGDRINVEINTPMTSLANVTMIGTLRRESNDAPFNLNGRLSRDHDIYNVNGTIGFYSGIPAHIDLRLRPVTRESMAHFVYTLNMESARKIIRIRIDEGDTHFETDTTVTVYSESNWDIASTVHTSRGLLSDKPDGNHCSFNAQLKPVSDGRFVAEAKLITPWQEFGIDNANINATARLTSNSGSLRTFYDFGHGDGEAFLSWTHIFLENMQALFDFKAQKPNGLRTLKFGMRYTNPGRSYQRIGIGGNVDVDSKVDLETNCSAMIISKTDISGSFAIRLPKPISDVHRFSGRYRGDIMESPIRDLMLETRYESDNERNRFASRAQYRNGSDLQTLIHAQWGTDTINKTFETNLQMLRKDERRELSARVQTPYFVEETIRVGGYYDKNNLHHVFNGSINYPGSREIGSTHIEYSSLANIRGFINCTTPFPNVTWLRTDLNYTTNRALSHRSIKTSWPSDFAFFDMDSSYDFVNTDRNHYGLINIEVPLATRHSTQIEYGLTERQTLTTGNCKVIYNEIKILDGKYQCKAESRAGFAKDVVEISLDNVRYPIGIAYVHQTEYSADEYPHIDVKRAELYDLKNSNRYNITGELHVHTTETGQAYKILAIHPNRTVVITSNYDVFNTTVNQRLKLLLSNDMWIAYDFKKTNLSTATNDSQMFNIDLQYPKRNLSTNGWYSITDDVFDSDLTFKWTQVKKRVEEKNLYDYELNSYDDDDDDDDDGGNDDDNEKKIENEERIIKAALTWRNEPLKPNDKCNQTILFVIKHPSFKKDVTFMANYYRNDMDLLHGKLIVDYHEKLSHMLTLKGGIMNSTQSLGHRNYSVHVLGLHEDTKFNLYALSSVAARSSVYETKNFGRYKRGFLPLQVGLLNAGVDFPHNDIHYHKVSPHKTFYVWGRANAEYPIYTLNGTYEDSPDVNTTAQFFLNVDNRFVKLDANFTPDATQNLRMLGTIPDARSASFDLWRDYEDIRIVDVAYYLRMNHSRLITSQLLWRPKLKAEIKDGVKRLSTQMYDSFAENIDFWLHTLYSEASETINEVWASAKPHTEQFLQDISGLSVIGEDIEEFRQLMNQSYESNDFYIKTVVNFTLTVLDELAIRNHIGSLPKILNEVWQVLGDSGVALRKSILWLVETIKTSYKHTIDALNRIFHGEAMAYISSLAEKALYRYDRFIKDLHLSFIKYVQNIWNIISDTIMDNWRQLLEKIQPMVMRFIHYGESLLWNVSQEVFDFLHKHTNDLVQSPYFDTVSEFMQDFDTVYQDIQKNDAITNIKKYSSLASAFLREKYFKVVPFGRELRHLINELIDEIKEMRKQELVQYVINRMHEWQQKLTWLAEEFQLDKRVHKLWQIVLTKITSYEQTALQMDDKYREAKTKFVFDPNDGIIKLEQKLPMAWHAFNETPMFEEISELRTVTKVFRAFQGVNISVMPFDVLQYYSNPYVWLPPFKARSLLVGSRHYITFDKRFVSLNHKYAIIKDDEKPDQCSYLLANDFVDSNFTLAQEPSTARFDGQLLSTRKLTMITDGNVIDIDMVADAIYINRTTTNALPIQLGNTVIYREWDNLVIQSKNGFELNCNMQFDFCWFEVSGWHFGKTAGIMGTMNNEMYDDFLTSGHHVTNDINEFRQSWALKECKHTFDDAEHFDYPISNELLNICDTYFRSKVSPFSNCFATVDSLPFYDMCLDMGSNSITNFTHIDHPAQKGACAVALAYMESCAEQNLPLRVPEICLHCNLINGSYVAEGSIFELNGDDVPKTTDVVFIVEAKPCNHDFSVNKNIAAVIAAMEKAFSEVGLQNARYAVVVFGGGAPFDNAHSIVYNNKIFTDSNQINHHFDHIQTGHSNSSDISRAIKVASELVFRPGASKQFILIPCSNCNVTMHFDYSSMLQFLWEHNINLHIFMNGHFETKKPRNEQKIFGFDNSHAYTNGYLKENVGNKELRSEIILPKNSLGFCMIWALQTNGTVFTANKLRPKSKTPIKKFAAVFAKRIAKAAIPSPCQLCECTGENTGVAYVTCTSCGFPNAFEDEDFNTFFDDKDFLEMDDDTDSEDE